MRLTREKIQRMVGDRIGGGSGGGGFNPATMAGYLTQGQAEERYLSKSFFSSVFRVTGVKTVTVTDENGDPVGDPVTSEYIFSPNELPATTSETDEESGETTTTVTAITRIQALGGVWTNSFVSALGMNGEGGGGGGGGASSLADLLDVLLTNPANGQLLVFDGTKWVNVPQSQITPDLTGYATQAWVQQQISGIARATGTFWGQTWQSGDVVTGSLTGVGGISMSGYIQMANNTGINIYGTDGNSLNVFILNSSNALGIGYGTRRAGMQTTVHGSPIEFVTGTSGVFAASITNAGQLWVRHGEQGIRIGDGLITWDSTNNALKVTKYDGTAASFYALGGISALGYGNSGSGGGSSSLADLLDVQLTNPSNGQLLSYNGQKWVNIDQSQITPDLTGYATQTWVQQQISGIARASGTFWGQTWQDGGTVTGSLTGVGNITMNGNVYMNNSRFIYGKDTAGVYLPLMGVYNDNTFWIGGGAMSRGYVTDIQGYNIQFTVGNSIDAAVFTAYGQLWLRQATQGLRIGDGLITWDSTNNALKVTKYDGTAASFYALGGISALGEGDCGGGGGASSLADLLDVQLTNPGNGQLLSYNGQKWVNIDQSQITPDLTAYATQTWVNSQLTSYATQQWVIDRGFATVGWVQQQGYLTSYTEQYTGTVTSVGLQVPQGLRVSGSPITGSGVITISYATGYSIPSNELQMGWQDAYDAMHTHSNKSVLDGITAGKVENWDTAFSWGNHAAQGYATQTWVNQNYLSIAFFGRLFQAYHGTTAVNPNDTQTTIDNIKAMFGFWTSQYLSAIGQNSESGGGGSGASILNDLLDVEVTNPDSGQLLSYNGQKWVNIDQSQITPDLTGYATQQWVTQQGYLTSQSIAGMATQTWVLQQNYASKVWVQQQGYLTSYTEQYTGTLQSVGLQASSGSRLQVSGSPVTGSSGTITVGVVNGYSIPSSQQQSAWTAKYDKPSGGIPLADLSSSVQASLGKADTALQSATGTFWGRSWSNGGNVSGDMTGVGNITMNGDVYMSNGKAIRIQSTEGSYMNVLTINYSNTFAVGYNVRTMGYTTDLQGNTIQFAVGQSERIEAGTITESGQWWIRHGEQGVRIGDGLITWDATNRALKITDSNGNAANLYAVGGISALGFQSGGDSTSIKDLIVRNVLTIGTGGIKAYDHLGKNLGIVSIDVASEEDIPSELIIGAGWNTVYHNTIVKGFNLRFDAGNLQGALSLNSNGFATFSGNVRSARYYLDDTRYIWLDGNALKYYNGTSNITIA